MDLPNLFSTNSEKENELVVIFIHLTSIKIQSFLLMISTDGVEILEKSSIANYVNSSDCLIKIDESLQELGEKSETVNSVIFGLNHSWVKDGEASKEKKVLLKKITDELSLNPLGFIVISEAIAQQKISQNSMFSGIITTLNKKYLTLSLIYQGKIKSVESVGRSSDEKGDLLEGIARFSAKSEKEGFYLPTKIVLVSMDLDETELKKYQQIIYDINWKNQPQFLQPPTAEIISKKDYQRMISKEAAKAVALQKGMTELAMAASINNNDTNNDNDKSQIANSTTRLNSNELGFSDVKIDDSEPINADEPIDAGEPINANKLIDDNKPIKTSFGVPISADNLNVDDLSVDDLDENLQEPDFNNNSNLAISENKNESGENKNEDKEFEQRLDLNRNKSGNNKLQKNKKQYKNFKLYALIGLISGLVALMIIGFFGLIYFTTANITINLKAKPISKDLEITLDSSIKETDIDNLILAAGKTSKSKQGKSTMQTTGVKIIGEKSKGKVMVYNATVAEKFFAKGTEISFGDLKFELDNDITIASASSPKPGVTEHGKVEANVTALQIGAESNLAKDTKLNVMSFDESSYYAYIIDKDFIGGVSREVKVVSQKDKTELLTDLRKELISDINKNLKEESKNGVYILPSNNIISEDAKFSVEVGDEADEISLTLDIKLEAITYTTEDLKPLATKVLDSEIPDNYKLSDSDPQILSAPTESSLDDSNNKKTLSLSANISSFAIPILSPDELKTNIKGKKIAEAKSLLDGKDEIKKTEIILMPNIANSFIKNIPKNLDKINIEFKSE